MRFPRRSILAGLLAAVAAPLWGQANGQAKRLAPGQSPLPEPRPDRGYGDGAEALIRLAKLGGEAAFAVARLGAPVPLAARHADVLMPPASVAKTVTTLYALEMLGPDHRFETRVMRLGPLDNGQLRGDLVLVGGGDPNLDSDRLGDLVAALAATGLRKVTGRFVVVDGAIPFRERLVPDQPDHVGYNPALSGLILNYNRVHFEWTRAGEGWTTTLEARGERFRPAVVGVEVAIVDRDQPQFTYARRDDIDRWTVARSALNDAGSRWLPVRDPAGYAASAFRELARAQGIDLPPPKFQATLPAGAEPVVSHLGEVLVKVLKSMLKFSNNLTAEVVGMTASGAGTLSGSGLVMTHWARRNLGVGVSLHDHSGLNSASRVSARDMLTVMQRAKDLRHGAILEDLMRETDLADAEGAAQKPAGTRVHAKSGTMNFVSGLAGYVRGADGQALAFAIFSGDLARRQAVPIWDREDPQGSRSWVKRARRLQGKLVALWARNHL